MAASGSTLFRAGRTFLVGDAVHRTTPVGGIGMNTAIHGAHNLGWKLAWVLRGWAGEALLDSYEAERRPIGTKNVLRSRRLSSQRAGEGLAWDIEARYTSPVVEADSGMGERAPHAWLPHDGARISTLDLFDGRLTVLTGPRDGPWQRAATELATDGLPIVALSAGRDLYDEDGAFARHYHLGDAGAALVRPDGVSRMASSRARRRRPNVTAVGCRACSGPSRRGASRPASGRVIKRRPRARPHR